MEALSLNKLAWRILKKNTLAFCSLIFIILCVFISFFAFLISPDKTPMANEMHIELATLEPFSRVNFLVIPKDKAVEEFSLKQFFFGNPLEFKRIPITTYKEINSGITYFPYHSQIQKEYKGEYKIDNQCFWFGTDKYGRDLLSRIIYGTRVSLAVGFISVLISLIIGIILGLFAGYFRGITDDVIMWFVNVMWSIPTLLMVIAITLALGKGFWQIFIAVGLTMWVEVARIVRGQVLSIREFEFVQAGKVLAYRSYRILFRHILPNIIGPIIVVSAANFSAAILIESGLSFLGIGVQPPMPSWGGMIKDHYGYIIMGKAYLSIIPGIAIMMIVLSFMFLGNGLRDAFDVKD